jgi:hypothetical protein
VQAANKTTGRDASLLALPAIVTEREAEALRAVPTWTATRTAILRAAAVRNAANGGKALKASSAAWTWYRDLAEEVAE